MAKTAHERDESFVTLNFAPLWPSVQFQRKQAIQLLGAK